MSVKIPIAIICWGYLLLSSGCFYLGQERFEDIVRIPPSKWSSRDCLTVILSAMVHNLEDKENQVEIIATPFYPSVVAALNQIQRTKYHWSEEDSRLHMDELLKGSSGLYVDWRDGNLVNAKGNYFRTQTDIDSLLVMLTLKNRTWPCVVPMTTVHGGDNQGNPTSKMVPMASAADWPCYVPDIDDIEMRIWLLNERGDTLRPKYVWGRRHESLTSTETLFLMFPFWNHQSHFLNGSGQYWLELSGFEKKSTFKIAVARMR